MRYCPLSFFLFSFFFFLLFYEFNFGFLVLVLGLKNNMEVEEGRLCYRWCSVQFPFRQLFLTHWPILVIWNSARRNCNLLSVSIWVFNLELFVYPFSEVPEDFKVYSDEVNKFKIQIPQGEQFRVLLPKTELGSNSIEEINQ